MPRLVLETPCEHGQMRGHCEHLNTGTHLDGDIRFGACVVTCEGGVRTTLNPDYEAAAEVTYGEMNPIRLWHTCTDQESYRESARRIVDAALGLDALTEETI